MTSSSRDRLSQLLARHEGAVLQAWLRCQPDNDASSPRPGQTDRQAAELLSAVVAALGRSDSLVIDGANWLEPRRQLQEFSAHCVRHGYAPSQAAHYVFSLKQPIFNLLRTELANQPDALADDIWSATLLVDALGLFTMECYQRSREEIITRQQQELLELSTPVVELWDNIIALPLIGTLDSARTQVVMESLLQKIVDTGSQIAIIDITGVPTVDTLVAQHLLKTVAAARLMGADCILSGIRPQIAQTIVHLGVDLSGVYTKASLADAFRAAVAMSRNTLPPAAKAPAPGA